MVEISLQNYTKLYKRRGTLMDNQESNKKKNLAQKAINHPFYSALISGVILMIIPSVRIYIFNFINLPKSLNTHIERFDELNGKFDQHIKEFEGLDLNNTSNSPPSHNKGTDIPNSPKTITVNGDNNEINVNYYSNRGVEEFPELSAESVLIESNGITVSASNLVGEKLIIPYKENNQEVYFMGQYDENIRWDGECLINTYVKNKLVNSTLAQYEHGKRKSYEQIYCEDDEWIYSIRTIIDDDTTKSEEEKIKSGDTWKYSKTKDYEQSIDYNYPTEDDFIYPDALKNELDERLISRYHGNTSNGKYNHIDTQPSAYLIKFDDDGTVKTLYYGNFKDGDFCDNTTHAWYITRNPEKYTYYRYYSGIFRKGISPDSNSKDCTYSEDPLTRGTFNRLLSDKSFDCPMLWAEEYISNTAPPVEE